MAYTKTNWVDGTTPLDQTNMNKIEDELYKLDGLIKTYYKHAITISGTTYKVVFEVVNGTNTAYTLSSVPRDIVGVLQNVSGSTFAGFGNYNGTILNGFLTTSTIVGTQAITESTLSITDSVTAI